MTSGRGSFRKAGWTTLSLGVAAAALLAACSADVPKQVAGNAQVREQVMGVIAADGTMAEEMTKRLMASDSLRGRVIETMLADENGAKYVIARIGRNPEAVDYVLQAAASDSAGRAHLMTLFKGMQIAMQSKK